MHDEQRSRVLRAPPNVSMVAGEGGVSERRKTIVRPRHGPSPPPRTSSQRVWPCAGRGGPHCWGALDIITALIFRYFTRARIITADGPQQPLTHPSVVLCARCVPDREIFPFPSSDFSFSLFIFIFIFYTFHCRFFEGFRGFPFRSTNHHCTSSRGP